MAMSDTPTLMLRDVSQSALTKIDAREGENGVVSGSGRDDTGTNCPFDIAARLRDMISRVAAETSTGSG
jgi:hypothetical protein